MAFDTNAAGGAVNQGNAGSGGNAWFVRQADGAGSGNLQFVDANGSSQVKLTSNSGIFVLVNGNGDIAGVLGAMQPSTDNPPAAASGVNAAATITFSGVGGQTNRLTWLMASYSGTTLVGGRLTVSDGTNNILDIDIVAFGPVAVPLPPGGLLGRANAAMTVTLAAGGAGTTGKVSAGHLQG